jgi:hypothetical protein
MLWFEMSIYYDSAFFSLGLECQFPCVVLVMSSLNHSLKFLRMHLHVPTAPSLK